MGRGSTARAICSRASRAGGLIPAPFQTCVLPVQTNARMVEELLLEGRHHCTHPPWGSDDVCRLRTFIIDCGALPPRHRVDREKRGGASTYPLVLHLRSGQWCAQPPPSPPTDTGTENCKTCEQTAMPRLLCTEWKPSNIARLETTSCALIPSTDTTVVSGLISHSARRVCATHSHPALVESACWKGDVAASTTLVNCCAMVNAVNLRMTSHPHWPTADKPPAANACHVECPTTDAHAPRFADLKFFTQQLLDKIEWSGPQMHQYGQEWVPVDVLVCGKALSTWRHCLEQDQPLQGSGGLTRVHPTARLYGHELLSSQRCSPLSLVADVFAMWPPSPHISCWPSNNDNHSHLTKSANLSSSFFLLSTTLGSPEQEQSWEKHK